MPIRLNLLAEAQAAEELRRKDPVKRAIIMGAGCAALMAIASLAIQSQVIATNHTAEGYTARIQQITNEYSVVRGNADRLQQINLNMRGLDILAAERFLNGNLLNALQKVYVDNVQLIHVRTEHNYSLTEEVRDKKDPKKVLKAGTAAEQIKLVVEARDSSDNPGDQVNKYKDGLSQNAYFQALLGPDNEMRLVNLTPPQVTAETGRPAVQFTLESHPPEKVRLSITSRTRYAPAADPTKKVPARKAPTGPVKL